jgi:hypothetical protein
LSIVVCPWQGEQVDGTKVTVGMGAVESAQRGHRI